MIARAFAVLLLAGGVAWPANAARDDTAATALAGRVAGKAQRCISLFNADGPQILEDGTILYRATGRRIWRTQAIGQCHLRPLDTLIVEAWGSQLCRNDRFRTVTPGISIPSAYCRFDAFTPYEKR